MSDVQGRYPASTSSGEAIPLDIVRPVSCLSAAFTAGASTSAFAIPATVKMISIYVSKDAILTFAAASASAAALVDGVAVDDTYILVEGTITTLSPPVGCESLALRGVSVSGTAFVNFLETWSGLSTAAQTTRR